MSDQTQVDVLIVGGKKYSSFFHSIVYSPSAIRTGGPVGLLAANLCIKSGFKVRIVGKYRSVYKGRAGCLDRSWELDIEFEPQHWGRGDWVHGRTLEILDHSGLATDLLQTGAKVESYAMHHQGHRTCEPFVPESVVTKYK